MLLEASSAPEDLALLAELPLERLQNITEGALCSDETAYHLEQQLELPSGWLDRMNSTVPETYLTLLANPLGRHDTDDTTLSSSASASATPQAGAAAPVAHSPPAARQPLSSKTLTLKAQSGKSSKNGDGDAVGPGQAIVDAKQNNAPESGPQQQSLLPDNHTPPSQDQVSTPAPTGLPSQPDNKPAMTTPTELHLANLNILLSGKGAKSALARLLRLSPASVTGMLNGVKPLDPELLQTVTQRLHLAENWFDKERTAADISAATAKLLSPLVRGASVPAVPAAPARSRAETKPPAAVPEAGHSGGQVVTAATPTARKPTGGPAGTATSPAAPKPSDAPPENGKPTTWPARGSKVSKLLGITSGGGAPASDIEGPAATASLNLDTATPLAGADSARATPAPEAEQAAQAVPAATALANAAPSIPDSAAPPRGSSRGVPEHQRGDTYAGMTALLSESVLPPIAEALIKTLALKASSGALSEDKAFELLGSVRTL